MKSFEIEERIRRAGREEGLAEAVLDLLGSLGDVPVSLREHVTMQEDEATLRTWVKLAAKVESIEEFHKQIMR